MAKNIQCLLIANRGEIALRIIRTCRRLGIRSAVIFADPDADMPFVREADVAVALGGIQVSETYLNIDKIIAAAQKVGADAVHPGYGFLSEQAAFASRVIAAGLIWVGPHPKAIEEMGLKARAKKIAAENEVPVIPGYQGQDQSLETLTQKALEIGFPVLIKASAGGGGKGMRIVYEENFLSAAIEGAQREALKSFGDADLLIEKYFPSARHIEIQVLGDKHGHCIHLLERECSIQRRYQKIMEESPSPVLTEAQREAMGAAALRLCKAIGYDNAGTVEFIYTPEHQFYFLEVNTRLQVEHPVTEAVTGLDLVEWQIRIAEGEKLSLQQSDIQHQGYALEFRLYAENPLNNFLPVSGDILDWYSPVAEGIRIDTGVESGNKATVYYDPMLAKIIATGKNRPEAFRRMRAALRQLRCQGFITNQRFLQALTADEHVLAGDYDTHFLATRFQAETAMNISLEARKAAAFALLLYRWQERKESKKILAGVPDGWRNSFYQMQEETYFCEGEAIQLQYKSEQGSLQVHCEGQHYQISLSSQNADALRISINGVQQNFFVVKGKEGQSYFVQGDEGSLALEVKDRYPQVEQEKIKGGYFAPMPGEILKVLVQAGQKVEEGTPLLILVSMKMENTISAAEAGTVSEVFALEGETVAAGKVLLKLDAETV